MSSFPRFLQRRAGLAALACAAAAPLVFAQSSEPVRIGVAVGLSGANSVIAPAVVQSSQLAVEEINAAGGILGRKIQLEIVDDGSGAVGAQKAFDTLVFQKKVDAVIAMETSAARNAALPIIARGKVPYIYTSFYEGRSCSPWMYVNAWVPEQQVAPIVNYFWINLNARNYFLVAFGLQ
jgi:branched-chain amino acid transport system substrate-binding protein